MRSRPSRSGPFVLPARFVLLFSGLLAIGLAVANVEYEFRGKQVDRLYLIIALVVAAVWLAALIAAFIGSRLGVFVTGAIGFIEFCVLASSHFVISPNDIDTLWKVVGLPVASIEMGLIVACSVLVVTSVVCWSSARGRYPSMETLPLLLVAVIGAVLVVLQATDDIHRADFGSSNAEDGTFSAAVFAAGWVLGALWIARVRRIGTLLIALCTFGVWFSFVTLHLLKGGITITAIASQSGVQWAAFGAAAAILAAASFVVAVAVLVLSTVRRSRRATSEERATLRRQA